MATDGASDGGGARVLMGRYRLEERVGRGGMGIVWRATDQLLERPVAVKEINPDEELSPEETRLLRARLLREGRAVARLGHPHIVAVHDIVESAERPYIVMELIEGVSLAERILRDGPLDEEQAAWIGLALLDALGEAHAAGVLHRDLKPANVLLESDTGRVVLTDFGVAQFPGASTLTGSGAFVGSPEYTAPERMSGERSGPEADLWSLGALLCAVLSGVSPFHRDSLGGVLHAVVSDEIHLPEQAGELAPLLRGLLERDPARRLDAAAAGRMLREFLDTGRIALPRADGVRRWLRADAVSEDGRTGARRPPGPRGRGLGPSGPRRVLHIALIVLAFVVAVATVGISAVALLMRAGGGPDGPPPTAPADSAPGSWP